MRALVISDTHFGAWTGHDLLREPEYLERLEPHLAELDEVVLLGDLFDLLFGSMEESFRASEGLLRLVRGNLQGRRFVFLAQRNVYGAAQQVGRMANALTAPIERAGRRLSRRGSAKSPAEASGGLEFIQARDAENERRRAVGGPALEQGMDYAVARVLRPSDPREHSLEAFSKVVANLDWGDRTDKIVFAHTHQPLDDVHAPGDARIGYWNTGSWIYEPDLSSPEAYASYLERAWPGTAILIDTDAPAPRLIETLADLNALSGGPGIRPVRLG